MIQLAKLFGTFGTGGWIIYAVIAAAILAVGVTSGTRFQRFIDAPTIAQLRTDVATEQGRTKDVRRALAEQQLATATDVVIANEKAIATSDAMMTTIRDLNAKLAVATKARQAASTQLLDTLKAIPHEQQVSLSPPVRAYLRSVRDQQAAGLPTAPGPPH